MLVHSLSLKFRYLNFPLGGLSSRFSKSVVFDLPVLGPWPPPVTVIMENNHDKSKPVSETVSQGKRVLSTAALSSSSSEGK